MKTCTKCQEALPTERFSKSAQHGGLHPWCKSCAAASQRAWRKRNRDRLKEYRAERADVIREQKRAAYWRDPESMRERSRAYAAKNRERLRDAQRERVADPEYREKMREAERVRGNTEAKVRARFSYKMRKLGAPLTADAAAIEAVVRRDPCAYCGDPGGTLDHIVPLSAGGDSDWTNLSGACARCNSSKGAKSLLQFLSDGGMRCA